MNGVKEVRVSQFSRESARIPVPLYVARKMARESQESRSKAGERKAKLWWDQWLLDNDWKLNCIEKELQYSGVTILVIAVCNLQILFRKNGSKKTFMLWYPTSGKWKRAKCRPGGENLPITQVVDMVRQVLAEYEDD